MAAGAAKYRNALYRRLAGVISLAASKPRRINGINGGNEMAMAQ
jgi:hypothetical protein